MPQNNTTRRGVTHAQLLQARLAKPKPAKPAPHADGRVVTGPDGRRWLNLYPAQLLHALNGARPKTMATVNAVATAWARGRGYDGAAQWTIADLVRADLAKKAPGAPKRSSNDQGFVTVGRFAWLV